MTDKVLKLKDNSEYYILKDLTFDEKKFVFCVECNSDTSTYKENYIILEMKIKNDKLIVKDVEDDKLLEKVSRMFLSKI